MTLKLPKRLGPYGRQSWRPSYHPPSACHAIHEDCSVWGFVLSPRAATRDVQGGGEQWTHAHEVMEGIGRHRDAARRCYTVKSALHTPRSGFATRTSSRAGIPPQPGSTMVPVFSLPTRWRQGVRWDTVHTTTRMPRRNLATVWRSQSVRRLPGRAGR